MPHTSFLLVLPPAYPIQKTRARPIGPVPDTGTQEDTHQAPSTGWCFPMRASAMSRFGSAARWLPSTAARRRPRRWWSSAPAWGWPERSLKAKIPAGQNKKTPRRAGKLVEGFLREQLRVVVWRHAYRPALTTDRPDRWIRSAINPPGERVATHPNLRGAAGTRWSPSGSASGWRLGSLGVTPPTGLFWVVL